MAASVAIGPFRSVREAKEALIKLHPLVFERGDCWVDDAIFTPDQLSSAVAKFLYDTGPPKWKPLHG